MQEFVTVEPAFFFTLAKLGIFVGVCGLLMCIMYQVLEQQK